MNYRPYQINSTYAKELKLPNVSKTIRYVPKRAFPDYLSEERISPSIIGCMDISKPKKTDQDRVEVATGGRVYQYPVMDKKKHLIGYVSVGGSNFVGMYDDNSFIIFPMILVFIWSIVIFLLFTRYKNGSSDIPDIPVAENSYEYTGDPAWSSPEIPEEEYIDIPGYTFLYLDENNRILQLVNPQGNSVYFVYTLQYNDDTIYKSDKIAPGTAVDADIFDGVETGEGEILMIIECYDVETGAPCNGARQTFKVRKDV